MEVKVLCSCGTKYKFDVDDSVSQLTDPIPCPECGLDGMGAANEFLVQAARQSESASPPATTRSAVQVARPAAPAPLPSTAAGVSPTPKKRRGYGEPNILLGTVGAVAAAAVGMIIWIGLIKMLNVELGIVAWGIGGLVGVVCRVLGGGYSRQLGVIAGGCALVAIVGGEFLGMRSKVNEFFHEMSQGAYEEQLAYANDAVGRTTDAEIREFLALHLSEEDQALAPDQVTSQQIAEFKQELPELREFINGKPSREEFLKNLREAFNSAEVQAEIFKHSVSFWTVLWLVLGVGTAWRLGSGEVQ